MARGDSGLLTMLRPIQKSCESGLQQWTAEEDAYVLKHYGQKPIYLIAKWLNRTSDAVRARRTYLRKQEQGS